MPLFIDDTEALRGLGATHIVYRTLHIELRTMHIILITKKKFLKIELINR
jgi:hypothetical protein